MSVRDRFRAKYTRIGECDEWISTKNHSGYGNFWLKGTIQGAHRVAWILAYGSIPDGMCVLHTCDNPGCVRVEHLFLGTQKDNSSDMVSKGRNRVTFRPIQHGTPGGYNNRNCRCDDCTWANTKQTREYRARKSR